MANRGPVAVVCLIVCVSLCAALSGVYISGYQAGIIDRREMDRMYVYCYARNGSFSSNTKVTWEVVQDGNPTLHIGSCYVSNSTCQLTYKNGYIRMRTYYSRLYVWDILRNMSGRLTCSAMMPDNTVEKDDIILNVYRRPSVENCRADFNRHNWTATFSCDISEALSTANLYTFQLHERYLYNAETNDIYNLAYRCLNVKNYQSLENEGTSNVVHWEQTVTEVTTSSRKSAHCVFHGHSSYRGILTPNDTKGQEYYSGHLEHSWQLSPYQAHNFTVRVSVCAGSRYYVCNNTDIEMPPLSLPSKPRHNCTDTAYIPESGGSRCVCTTEDLGSPEGRLLWMRGEVTLAAGQYGVRQLPFPTVSLTRDQNEGLLVCKLDWIKPDLAIPQFDIAYGPDSVDVKVYHHYDTNDKLLLILIECQVSGLNPRTPDMVQWGGPCQGQTGFMCTLDPRESDVRGKAVTCHVTNTANNKHSIAAAAIIRIESGTDKSAEAGTDKSAEACKGQLQWAGIGGAVILAVCVVITLLVVLVLWIYRRAQLRPKGDSSKPADITEGHLYEALAVTTGRGRCLPTPPEPDNVYENTGFNQQEGHM